MLTGSTDFAVGLIWVGLPVGKSSVSICLHFSSWINSPEKPLSVFCLAGKGRAAGVLGAECMKRARAWRVVPSNRTYGHLAPLFSVLDSISQLCLGYPQSRDPPHSPKRKFFSVMPCWEKHSHPVTESGEGVQDATASQIPCYHPTF